MNITNLTASDIAILTAAATMIGGIVAAVASIAGALVSARSTKLLEYRQHKLQRLEPLLQFIDQRSKEVVDLQNAIRSQAWPVARALLEEMVKTQWVQFSSGLGIIASDKWLDAQYERWIEADQSFRKFAQTLIKQTAEDNAITADELAQLNDRALSVLVVADLTVDAITDVVFNVRTWKRVIWGLRRDRREGSNDPRRGGLTKV